MNESLCHRTQLKKTSLIFQFNKNSHKYNKEERNITLHKGILTVTIITWLTVPECLCHR